MTCDVWSTCPLLRARSGRRRVKAAVWTTQTVALWRGECRVIYTLGPWALAPCLVRCIIYTRGISDMYSVVKCVCFRKKKKAFSALDLHVSKTFLRAGARAVRRPAPRGPGPRARPAAMCASARRPGPAVCHRYAPRPSPPVSRVSLTHCSVSLYNSRTYLSSLS